MSLSRWIRERNGCLESLEWVGESSAAQAWSQCSRGDWLLWLVDRCPSIPPEDRQRLARACTLTLGRVVDPMEPLCDQVQKAAARIPRGPERAELLRRIATAVRDLLPSPPSELMEATL